MDAIAGRARRRSPVSRAAVALGIVVVLLIYASVVSALAWADQRLRQWVETTAEQEIARRVPQADRVDVRVEGFPFTLDLLLDQRVEGLHVHVDAIERHGIRATDLRLDVEGLVIDDDALLDEGRLSISSIDFARIEGFLATDEIAEIVGHPIEIEDHDIWATVGTQRVRLEPQVQDSWLELYVEGTDSDPMVFPLPTHNIRACRPIVATLGDRLRLSCAMNHLPEVIRRALASG